MKIFTQIKNSIYNKEYYNTVVLNETLGKSIKYLAKLSLVVAFIGVLVFSFSIPKLKSEIKKGIATFAERYPNDLVVSINNGIAQINKPEPYIVKLPENLLNKDDTKSLKIDNLITVNTGESFNLDKFREYSTLSLLTKKELVMMQSEKGDVSILPLSNMGNVEITKAFVLEKEAWAYKALPWAMTALVPLIYPFIFLGIFISTLISLFFYAAIVWVILKSKKVKVNYLLSYQVALHAVTPILIIGAFGIYLAPLNSMFIRTVILIAIVYFNFNKNEVSE